MAFHSLNSQNSERFLTCHKQINKLFLLAHKRFSGILFIFSLPPFSTLYDGIFMNSTKQLAVEDWTVDVDMQWYFSLSRCHNTNTANQRAVTAEKAAKPVRRIPCIFKIFTVEFFFLLRDECEPVILGREQLIDESLTKVPKTAP